MSLQKIMDFCPNDGAIWTLGVASSHSLLFCNNFSDIYVDLSSPSKIDVSWVLFCFSYVNIYLFLLDKKKTSYHPPCNVIGSQWDLNETQSWY